MFIRLKQTLFVDIFCQTGLQKHNEVIYKRHLKSPMKGVVKVVKVIEATHGYDGFMGLGVNHPALLKESLDDAVKVTSLTDNLLDFLKQEAESGSHKTASDILAIWTKTSTQVLEEKNKSPTEISLNSVSSRSNISSVTDSGESVSTNKSLIVLFSMGHNVLTYCFCRMTMTTPPLPPIMTLLRNYPSK